MPLKRVIKNELKHVNSCGKRSDIAQMRDSGTEEETGSRCWSWQAGGQGEERGHEVSWFARRGCTGWSQMEAHDWLWSHLKGTVQRMRRLFFSKKILFFK